MIHKFNLPSACLFSFNVKFYFFQGSLTEEMGYWFFESF